MKLATEKASLEKANQQVLKLEAKYAETTQKLEAEQKARLALEAKVQALGKQLKKVQSNQHHQKATPTIADNTSAATTSATPPPTNTNLDDSIKNYIQQLLAPILEPLTKTPTYASATANKTHKSNSAQPKPANKETPPNKQSKSTTTPSNPENLNTPNNTANENGPVPSTSDTRQAQPTTEDTPETEPNTTHDENWTIVSRKRGKNNKQTQPSTTSEGNRGQKKRPRRAKKLNPATVLLLPNADCPSALQKLQNLPEADPRTLGIKRHVQFPSRALLVTCEQVEQADKLRSIASKAGLMEKEHSLKPSSFRIHNVPPQTTTEQMFTDITKRIGNPPEKVDLYPYRDMEKTELFAVVTCTAEMLALASKVKTIRLGWAVCRIDCRVHVRRCSNCCLLGHSEKKCQKMTPTNTDLKSSPTCIDCEHYNSQQMSATANTKIKIHARKTDHPTGSKACPTLAAFIRKATPSTKLTKAAHTTAEK